MQLDTYNIETDGQVRYVNGGMEFVPWMEGIDDEKYMEFMNHVMDLDWGDYKLYLVGGMLEGWKTTDIDICVTGTIGDDLPGLMEQVHQLGPIDIFYVESLEKIKGNKHRVWEFAKCRDMVIPGVRLHGQWKTDGLFWMSERFDAKGRTYTKDPLPLN